MTGRNLKSAAAGAAVALLSGMFFLTSLAKADDKPAKADTWKSFSYTEDGFSVSFPVEPKKTKKNTTNYDAPVSGGEIQYTVVVSAPPPKDKTPKEAFDEVVKKFGDKVKSTRDIELQGFPGREMVIELEVQGMPLLMTNRMYVANDHLYQTISAGLKSKKDDIETKKFQDSFKLLVDKK